MSGFYEQNTTAYTSVATTTHHTMENARHLNSTLVCVKDSTNYPHLVELSMSVAVLPFHLFVLIAMLAYRDVVKRNMVNLYAGNVFVANIVMVSWRILTNAQMYSYQDRYTYEIINGTFEHDDRNTAFIWWTFKKQFQLVLLLVTCGSIGLVINVMRSSMFRLHRTVAGLTLRQSFGPSDKERGNDRKITPSCYKRMRRMVRKHPKAHAATLLLTVWIFPIVLSGMVVSLHVSYCNMKCRCAFDTYPVTDRQDICEVDEDCSNIFPPVSNLLIAVGVGLLVIYVVFMGLMLYKTFRDFRNIVKQRLAEAALAKDDNELKSVENSVAKADRNSTVKEDDSNGELGSSERDVKREGNLDRGREASVRFAAQSKRKKSVPGSIFLQSGRTNLRLLFLMFGSYLIGVLPLVIFTMVEGFDSGQREVFTESPDKVAPLLALPILSEFFCTLMLCIHLSGIKSATRLLLITLVGCVTKRNN